MKTFFYPFLIILLFVACSRNEDIPPEEEEPVIEYDRCACMNMPRPDDSYNYQTFFNSEEWKNMTNEERHEFLEVPAEILEKMSTQAVFQAMWEYPLGSFGMFLSFKYQSTYNFYTDNYRAFKEFTKRDDAGQVLFERFVLLNPLAHLPLPCLEFPVLEVSLSQYAFLSQLSHEQKRKVIEVCFKNDESRQKHRINVTNRPAIFLLLARVLASDKYTPFLEAIEGNVEFEYYLIGLRPHELSSSGYTGFFYYNDHPFEQIITHFSKRYLDNQP